MSTQKTMQIPIQSGDENIFHNKNPLNIEENIWVRVTPPFCVSFLSVPVWGFHFLFGFEFFYF
jgi:hypothetical protein